MLIFFITTLNQIMGWSNMYLQFNTLQETETANNQIAQNMGLIGSITAYWDNIIKTADDKFVITKPDERFMYNIINFQETESYRTIELTEDVY